VLRSRKFDDSAEFPAYSDVFPRNLGMVVNTSLSGIVFELGISTRILRLWFENKPNLTEEFLQFGADGLDLAFSF
jgi:hypothetical protein